MARVSENSSTASIKYSVNKSKEKLEDLQLKGSNLKRMIKPSDDPIGNVELMKLRANKIETDQFEKNANISITSLDYIENSLKDLVEIMNKAKEIAVAQSSDLYNPEVRKSVSKEIAQLYKQSIGIANRRLGNRYIFSGHKTLNRPFTNDGQYLGDKGTIYLEVLKDFYVPTNIPGNEVFYLNPYDKVKDDNPLNHFPEVYSPQQNQTNQQVNQHQQRKKLEEQNAEDNSYAVELPDEKLITAESYYSKHDHNNVKNSLFDVLKMLEGALVTNNPDMVQNLLNQFDDFVDHLITLRTRIGSTINTVTNSEATLSDIELYNATRKSKIEDADIAELFSDLNKQGQLLQASYKTSSKLINENLLDFLR